MARTAFLEAFDVIEGGSAAAPSEEWVFGHAAGLAEGLANARADQGTLADELVQTLSDMSFGYREAHSHLSRALTPLFTQLVTGFVPPFARAMLVPAIAESIAQTAMAGLDAPITLCVAAGQQDAVSSALSRITDLPFALRGDAGLSPGQAVIQGGAGEHILDIDALIRQAQAILEALLDDNQQRSENG